MSCSAESSMIFFITSEPELKGIFFRPGDTGFENCCDTLRHRHILLSLFGIASLNSTDEDPQDTIK